MKSKPENLARDPGTWGTLSVDFSCRLQLKRLAENRIYRHAPKMAGSSGFSLRKRASARIGCVAQATVALKDSRLSKVLYRFSNLTPKLKFSAEIWADDGR
jgi:hypothetical protein